MYIYVEVEHRWYLHQVPTVRCSVNAVTRTGTKSDLGTVPTSVQDPDPPDPHVFGPPP